MKNLNEYIKESNIVEQEKLLNSVKDVVSAANKEYEVRIADDKDIVEKKSKGCVVVVVNGDEKEQTEARNVLKDFKFTTYGNPPKELYFIKK